MFDIWLKHFIYENCIDVAFKNFTESFMTYDAPKFNEVIIFMTQDRRWLKFSDVVLTQERGHSGTKFVSLRYQASEVKYVLGGWDYKGGSGSFPLTLHDIRVNVFIEPTGFKHILEQVYER